MRAQRRERLPNWLIGVILFVILAIASLYAFTKELPWVHKYTVEAVFENAGNVRPSSPVRIAGVNVGKVTSIEHLSTATAEDGATTEDGSVPESATVVTMELEESALPLRTDATLKLRPRLFLEGNLFVDLRPGSPNAPEAEDGYTFPVNQTSVAVQLDQVLTTLQADVRTDLQILLHEFGDALIKYGGAEGFRELYRTSPGAFRYTAEVNEAFLGTEPHDLSDLIVNLDSTVDALGRNEVALKDLVTNLRIVTGSFAAEDQALEQALVELPGVLEAGEPALASLNRALPPLRAFAREALPGVRSTPAMLDATTPFLHQVRGLVSKPELRGLVADLRPTIPSLAKLAKETIPVLDQSRFLGSCLNEVVTPWNNMTINDPETPATGKVFEELGYGLLGIAGESRSGDGNGQYIRVQAGGGLNTVVLPDSFTQSTVTEDAVGVTPLPILGGRPAINSSAKTPFRPDVPCETNDAPNLDSGQLGPAPEQATAPAPAQPVMTSAINSAMEALQDEIARANELLAGSRKDQIAGAKLQQANLLELGQILAPVLGPAKSAGYADPSVKP